MIDNDGTPIDVSVSDRYGRHRVSVTETSKHRTIDDGVSVADPKIASTPSAKGGISQNSG